MKFKPFNVEEFKKYSELYNLEFNRERTLNLNTDWGEVGEARHYYFNVNKELIHKCDLCNRKETITKILIKVNPHKSFLDVKGIIRECATCELIKNLKDKGETKK